MIFDESKLLKISRIPSSLGVSGRGDLNKTLLRFSGECSFLQLPRLLLSYEKNFLNFLIFRKGEIIQKYLFEENSSSHSPLPARTLPASIKTWQINIYKQQKGKKFVRKRMEISVVEINGASLSYSNDVIRSPTLISTHS